MGDRKFNILEIFFNIIILFLFIIIDVISFINHNINIV